ncbi:hypothetical protein BT96DRAFT_789430, partial [Gymnopus androsaceus JB14]
SAQWTYSDTKNFLNFLALHCSEMGEGFSFKTRTFNAAAEHMVQFTTVGGVKDAAACRSKWQEFNAIGKIKAKSGWGPWSDEHGAGITALTAESWDNFVKKNAAAKPFRNHGWDFLHQVEAIMPFQATGMNV